MKKQIKMIINIVMAFSFIISLSILSVYFIKLAFTKSASGTVIEIISRIPGYKKESLTVGNVNPCHLKIQFQDPNTKKTIEFISMTELNACIDDYANYYQFGSIINIRYSPEGLFKPDIYKGYNLPRFATFICILTAFYFIKNKFSVFTKKFKK